MSYSLDANVLLHAANLDSPHHAAAVAFLDTCARSDEPLCLTWGTLSAFLRIATSPTVFARPLAPREAMELVEELVNLPPVRLLTEEPGFWSTYSAVAAVAPPRGKAVPDAHLAALLKHHEVPRLYTSDRDFLRYPFLDVRDPLAPDGGRARRRRGR